MIAALAARLRRQQQSAHDRHDDRKTGRFSKYSWKHCANTVERALMRVCCEIERVSTFSNRALSVSEFTGSGKETVRIRLQAQVHLPEKRRTVQSPPAAREIVGTGT